MTRFKKALAAIIVSTLSLSAAVSCSSTPSENVTSEPTSTSVTTSANITDFALEYRTPFVPINASLSNGKLQVVVNDSVGETHESGWTYATNGEIGSSPVLKDVNNDGKLEILLTSTDGYIYLLNYKGENLPGWPRPFPDMYEVVPYANVLARSVPSIADIDNDGEDEIVARGSKYIHAWNLDGSYVDGWPVLLENNIYSNGLLGSTTIADLDGDGFKEIITGHCTQLHVYNYNGSEKPGWPKTFDSFWMSTALATPDVADLDGDGKLEIIFETDEYKQNEPIHVINIWHADGTGFAGWPVELDYPYKNGEAKQYASTLVADVDNDKQFDVLVPTWDKVYVFGLNGKIKYSWPVNLHAVGFLSLGDFNNDNLLEIATGHIATDVYLYRYNGSLISGWPQRVHCFSTFSAISGSVDDDPESEIILAGGGGCTNTLGFIYAWNYDGSLANGSWPKIVSRGIISAPALGDIDGDGYVEMVAGSRDGNIYLWDLSAKYIAKSMQWPMFHHDTQHTGTYPMTISSPVGTGGISTQ